MYSSNEFNDLFFPIHGVKDVMSVDRIKDLKSVKHISDKDRDKVVKFFVYLYDKGTPVFKKESDLEKRKKVSANLAGFTKNDRKLFEEVSTLKVAASRDLLFEMLQVQNNRLWIKIIAQEKYFSECAEVLIKSVELESDKDVIAAIEKKSKLSKEMDEIDERLKRYWTEFTMGDEETQEVVRTNSTSPEARLMRYANN